VTAFVVASGLALPDQVVSNEELASQLGLSPEQIVKSSGMKERRWAQPGTSTSQLAAEALNMALQEAGVSSADIDYLILGTMTPDRFVPGSARKCKRHSDYLPLGRLHLVRCDLSPCNN